MDVLKLIENQIDEIKKEGHSSFLDTIFNHLGRAEKYYSDGKSDPHYYNDVVYRTNQAFEGALKESYKVLGNKTDEETLKKSPHEIEKYLKDNNVFKERVLKLFEHYRQEWRNKSTHDYRLILDENEAFLAVLNVSSFVHVLLKQIQERVAYENELKKEASSDIKKETVRILNDPSEDFVHKILHLLKIFLKSLPEDLVSSENEFAGRLMAFFEKVDSKYTVYREPKYKILDHFIRPDFVIEYEAKKVIIEIKISLNLENIKLGIDQIVAYLKLLGLTTGILLLGKINRSSSEVKVDIYELPLDEIKYYVYVIL
jgi:hypothetical protein